MIVMRQKSDDEDSNLKDDALRDSSVINDDGLILGLPSTIFIGGVVFSLLFGAVLHWVIGVVFAVVYFIAMYSIHEDDPKALRGWTNAALRRRKDAWSGAVHKGRKVYFFDIKD